MTTILKDMTITKAPSKQNHGSEEKRFPWEIRLVYYTTVLAMGILFMLLLVYRYEDQHIEVCPLLDFEEGNIQDISYHFDEIRYTQQGDAIIKGWLVRRGITYNSYNYGDDTYRSDVYNYMHLCMVKGDSVYIFPTKLELRSDVSNYINDGIDYRYCGFRARITSKNSDLMSSSLPGMVVQLPDGTEILYCLSPFD